MRDALGFLKSVLALPQVAKHQQAGQSVGQPSADLQEKPLLLRRPDPRVRALVQPEHVRFVHLGIDGHSDEGLYVETFRELCRYRMRRSRAELHSTAGSS